MPAFRFIALLCLLGLAAQAQLPSFHAPAQSTGSITVKLHPMENVTTGTPTLVTFGVPFTRGSITSTGLNTVRVLHNGTEIPAFVEQLTPWRHLTNNSIDGQSVRVARIQIRHSFSAAYPASEDITVQWGSTARTQSILTFTDPLSAWHTVTSGTYVAADGVQEPDVYALLPKSMLSQGVLSLRRSEPFADHIPEARDNPNITDATEHWPGYEEADRAFKNFFYTNINQDDPLVTGYESGQLVDYKNESEPWLYDRSSTFFQLYIKTGFLRPLREAVRATQFYKTKLYGTAVADPYRGVFRLKAPTLGDVTAGNTSMYSYAECFAYDHWLTGHPGDIEPVRWVVNTHEGLTEQTRWSPTAGEWTERHTAFRTLANIVAFELTGESAFKLRTLSQMGDYMWHQNGADGQVPANRQDGGLYHYGRQHGDGVFTELIGSPWMLSLLMDAMLRGYGISEDPAVANFIRRAAKFQAVATHYNDDHIYEYSGALRYPYYLSRFDGAPDAADGYDNSSIEHSKEVLTTIAWGNYFQHLIQGVPDPMMEANARDLYLSYDIGVNHWTRPAAPPLGLTAFRSIPPRKLAWENRPSASLTWIMSLIDTISPPPTVVITSPVVNQLFTAPANILIEATATSPNATITKVEFFDGAVKIGEDTTAPYSLQWNGIIASLPSHVLTAKATTSLGVVGNSQAVGLDVRSPTQPSLTIVNPAPGTVFDAPANVVIAVNATPQGNSTITRVLITQSYQFIAEDTTAPYTHTVTGLTHGTHGYEIWAWDNNGGYTMQILDIRVQSTTPPTVNLTSPTLGTTTTNGATLHLEATASAPGSAITEVVFYADSTPVGSDDTAPYTYDWTISSRWAVGQHTLTARAFETNGSFASSSTTFELASFEPMTASFDSPAQNAVFPFPAAIPMQASATAPGSSIVRVDFYANNTFVSSDTEAPYTANYTPTSIRQWELMARAVDGMGRTAEARRTVHVTGPTIPNVTITSPTAGGILVVPATTTITADASANFATITRVQFYDGGTLLGEDTDAPFSFTTPPLSLGDHTLYAVATSSTGTTGTSPSVPVTVGGANAPVAVVTAPRYSGPQFAASFSTVRFAAGAMHTGGLGIQRVEFYLDNVLLAQDTQAPYEMDWTVGPNTGYHELVARAVDVNNAFANSSRVGFELIIPPAISLTTPVNAAQVTPGDALTLTAAVSRGTYSIEEVRFYVGSTLIGTDSTAPYSVSWTPDTQGAKTISAMVRDTRFVDVWSQNVIVNSAFTVLQSWRIEHFGSHSNLGNAADDADPDGDLLPNIIEWIIATDPEVSEAHLHPTINAQTSDVVCTFTRNDEAEGSSTLTFQWSGDLTIWNDVMLPAASAGPDGQGVRVNVVENGTSPDTITVSLPKSNGPDGRLFTRLKGGQ
ncbi:Ig-like domain-containing protein [Brevifollis gellanilyticus]|nr:Ig-like domain-containing protein [Brevifollis gellanilyticus]